MDLKLTEKCALVTGGGGGIGRAIARQLLLEGVRVAIASRSLDRCAEAARELAEETGGDVLYAQVDTAETTSVQSLANDLNDRLGGIDILVNCAARVAGGEQAPTLFSLTDEAFWEEVNVKVLGYIRVARAVAPSMVERGWGRIINIAGLQARTPVSLVGSIRNISVAAMTKNLANELGQFGINVTVVHPGYTRTERTATFTANIAKARGISDEEALRLLAANALGRVVDASEVADVVAFLASPRSVAINGDAVAVGGGQIGAIHY